MEVLKSTCPTQRFPSSLADRQDSASPQQKQGFERKAGKYLSHYIKLQSIVTHLYSYTKETLIYTET